MGYLSNFVLSVSYSQLLKIWTLSPFTLYHSKIRFLSNNFKKYIIIVKRQGEFTVKLNIYNMYKGKVRSLVKHSGDYVYKNHWDRY